MFDLRQRCTLTANLEKCHCHTRNSTARTTDASANTFGVLLTALSRRYLR